MTARDFPQRREKYMRQPMPRRLGNLASNLNRIATYSDGSFSKESIFELVRESQYFAEWTAEGASLELTQSIVDMQRQLAKWKLHWDEVWQDENRKSQMQKQAKAWSDHIIEHSGLLEEKV
jgi:hypothetical protein